ETAPETVWARTAAAVPVSVPEPETVLRSISPFTPWTDTGPETWFTASELPAGILRVRAGAGSPSQLPPRMAPHLPQQTLAWSSAACMVSPGEGADDAPSTRGAADYFRSAGGWWLVAGGWLGSP